MPFDNPPARDIWANAPELGQHDGPAWEPDDYARPGRVGSICLSLDCARDAAERGDGEWVASHLYGALRRILTMPQDAGPRGCVSEISPDVRERIALRLAPTGRAVLPVLEAIGYPAAQIRIGFLAFADLVDQWGRHPDDRRPPRIPEPAQHAVMFRNDVENIWRACSIRSRIAERAAAAARSGVLPVRPA